MDRSAEVPSTSRLAAKTAVSMNGKSRQLSGYNSRSSTNPTMLSRSTGGSVVGTRSVTFKKSSSSSHSSQPSATHSVSGIKDSREASLSLGERTSDLPNAEPYPSSSSSPYENCDCGESCPNSDPTMCQCGTDVFGRLLGPTADESILAGLQSIFDICRTYQVCEETALPQEDTADFIEATPCDGGCLDVPVYIPNDRASDTTADRFSSFEPPPPPTVSNSRMSTIASMPQFSNKLIQVSNLNNASTTMKSASVMASPSAISQSLHCQSSGLSIQDDCCCQPDSECDCCQCHQPQICPVLHQVQNELRKGKPCCRLAYPKKKKSKVKEYAVIPCSTKKCNGHDELERDCCCSSKKAGCTCIAIPLEEDCSCCDCPTPAEGDCCRCPDPGSSEEVRYAIARIRKFQCFTTYEILKSPATERECKCEAKHRTPKESYEGVFLIKKKKGSKKKYCCN